MPSSSQSLALWRVAYWRRGRLFDGLSPPPFYLVERSVDRRLERLELRSKPASRLKIRFLELEMVTFPR